MSLTSNTTFLRLSGIANANGLSDMTEKYAAVIDGIYADSMRRYAVLGDSNSGKSTVVNALVGREAAPVSLISSKHDKKLVVESPEHGCIFVELNSDTYTADGSDPAESPLWTVDAALYVMSALSPFTAADVDAIKKCVARGIPCTIVLNKLNMVDEEDVELTLTVVRNQLFSLFQSDELIIFDRSAPAESAEKIIRELESAEDSREVREYSATIEFARVLETAVGGLYGDAKARYEALTSDDSDATDELFWEDASVELEKRKLSLTVEIDKLAHRLYGDCTVKLTDTMLKSEDPEQWWKRTLPRAMKAENKEIGDRLGKTVEEMLGSDTGWLSGAIRDRFHIDLKVEDIDRNFAAYEAVPGNINDRLSAAGAKRRTALMGLAASGAVLAGGLLLPFPMVTSIVACSIAGVAVVGTGFWAFLEHQNAEEEKKSILRRELDKYVSQCRDSALTDIKHYIGYCYDNLVIAAKDAQMFKMSEQLKPTEEQARAMAELSRLAGDKKAVDDIIKQTIFE